MAGVKARVAAALAVGGVLAAGVTTAAPARAEVSAKPTIVLVHGAWADSGSWDGVVARLQHDGYPVDVFPTPLRSLAGDSARLRDYLGAITGPVVLVGHSYGGAVVTDAATGNANIKALVYLDAFAPSQGVPVASYVGPDSAVFNPTVFNVVGPEQDLYVKPDQFRAAFANDLPAGQGAVLAATQRPITLSALAELSTSPAWRSIPSWYEVGTVDKVIPPATQLSMARAIGAHITRARTSHLPMLSQPGTVTHTIESAAQASTR